MKKRRDSRTEQDGKVMARADERNMVNDIEILARRRPGRIGVIEHEALDGRNQVLASGYEELVRVADNNWTKQQDEKAESIELVLTRTGVVENKARDDGRINTCAMRAVPR